MHIYVCMFCCEYACLCVLCVCVSLCVCVCVVCVCVSLCVVCAWFIGVCGR